MDSHRRDLLQIAFFFSPANSAPASTKDARSDDSLELLAPLHHSTLALAAFGPPLRCKIKTSE
jgi:hypothetical protein